jgi:hypothetical protein
MKSILESMETGLIKHVEFADVLNESWMEFLTLDKDAFLQGLQCDPVALLAWPWPGVHEEPEHGIQPFPWSFPPRK